MKGKRIFKTALIIVVVVGLIVVYKTFDPSDYAVFPKCPSLLFTGYECAGCGSQRALHHLLNMDIKGAMSCNPLLVLLIPYMVLLFALEYSVGKTKFPRLYRALTGQVAILSLIIIIILFSILRNIWQI
ncbi:MAG: DUF2752 domain-containing protein [Rikenellaceae bacterium]